MRDVLIKISAKLSEDGQDHYLVTWKESENDPLTTKLPVARIDDRFNGWNDAKEWQEKPFRQTSGDYLFQLLDLFQDSNGSSILKALVLGPPATLTFQIEDSRLRTFPWELIRFRSIVAVSRHRLKFRSSELAISSEKVAPEDWPLRILAIKGTSDSDTADTGTELDHIRQSGLKLGPLVNLQVMEQPGAVEITRMLETFKPHIFHFSGHGRFNDQDGFLTLTTRDGTKQKWAMENVLATFGTHCPKCVILNACETSKSGSHGESVWSIAETLLAFGCEFVIAMQGAIKSSEATIFGQKFFSHLAAQLETRTCAPDIISAFHAARHQLVASTNHKDWCLPRLLEKTTLPGPVFREIQQTSFIDNDLFKGTLPFLDRFSHREKFGALNDFFSMKPEKARMVLHATERSGLTYLLQFVIATAELNGCLVDYQSYDQLSRISKASLCHPIRKFITDILRGKPGEIENTGPDGNIKGELDALLFHRNEKAAERNHPFVIAFDHLDLKKTPDGLESEVRDSLLSPTFQESYPHLRIILGMRSEVFQKLGFSNAQWQVHEIKQELIPNIAQHYREYVRYLCAERNFNEEKAKVVLNAMNTITTSMDEYLDPGSPVVFQNLKDFIRR